MPALTTAKTRTRRACPARCTRGIDTLERMFWNRLERRPGSGTVYVIAAADLPSAEQRRELETRAAELADALLPGEPRQIEMLILRMRIHFNTGEDENTVEITTRDYARALARFPAWAVEEACTRVMRNQAETIRASPFAPKPPQLAAECERVLTAIVAEYGRLVAVLHADVDDRPLLDATQRAQIAEKGLKRFRGAV
jgi:hypothetical protein